MERVPGVLITRPEVRLDAAASPANSHSPGVQLDRGAPACPAQTPPSQHLRFHRRETKEPWVPRGCRFLRGTLLHVLLNFAVLGSSSACSSLRSYAVMAGIAGVTAGESGMGASLGVGIWP
jgi:hypothetical protein